jgi:transposase InsO family protein
MAKPNPAKNKVLKSKTPSVESKQPEDSNARLLADFDLPSQPSTDHSDEDEVTSEVVCSTHTPLPAKKRLNDEQEAIFAPRYHFVFYVDQGLSIREAMKRAGMTCTDSAARKLYKRYKEAGTQALMDGRWFIEHKNRVLTTEVTKRLLEWYFARPAAGPNAIYLQIEKEAKTKGVKPPSYESVKKFFAKLPKSYKQFRQGKIGIREWSRQTRPVVRYDPTTFSNQRWQVDHKRLRIWVRVKVGELWVPMEAHISAFLDCTSRAIPGCVVSAKQPDSWTMSILMMKAVLPKENPLWTNKGLPVEIQPDRGKNLIADHVISIMARLGIDYIPDPPYYPDNKGKVERWFLTLETRCLKILPGHMKAIGKTSAAAERHVAILLTVPQLRQEIERWITEDYHKHKHSETGRKPAELWEETVRMLPPNDEEVFTLCLLKDNQERVVGNTGVRFTPRENNFTKNRYWSPELTQYGGQSVRVAYNPDDLECIHLYDAETDEFLCEAWWMNSPSPHYTVEDVKSARNTFRRGMCQRLKEYRATIEQEDRLNARQVEWENARRIAESIQDRAASIMPADPQPDEVEALLELLERQAAGEE